MFSGGEQNHFKMAKEEQVDAAEAPHYEVARLTGDVQLISMKL
jgi:hypothetical protein